MSAVVTKKCYAHKSKKHVGTDSWLNTLLLGTTTGNVTDLHHNFLVENRVKKVQMFSFSANLTLCKAIYWATLHLFWHTTHMCDASVWKSSNIRWIIFVLWESVTLKQNLYTVRKTCICMVKLRKAKRITTRYGMYLQTRLHGGNINMKPLCFADNVFEAPLELFSSILPLTYKGVVHLLLLGVKCQVVRQVWLRLSLWFVTLPVLIRCSGTDTAPPSLPLSPQPRWSSLWTLAGCGQ